MEYVIGILVIGLVVILYANRSKPKPESEGFATPEGGSLYTDPATLRQLGFIESLIEQKGEAAFRRVTMRSGIAKVETVAEASIVIEAMKREPDQRGEG